MKGLQLALGFLTTLPVRTSGLESTDLGRAAVWFPAVGMAIGALIALAHLVLGRVFPALLAGALVVALWVALTGGLHLDGLADCCDGLFAPVTPAARLAIMRDPNLGSYAAVGLALFLVLKIVSVASLAPPARLALLLAATLGRWLVLPVAFQPTAAAGLGAEFGRGLRGRVLLVGALVPLALVLLGGWRALVAAAAAHLAGLGVVLLARARLGGVTGDVLGLTVEMAELAVLLVYALA